MVGKKEEVIQKASKTLQKKFDLSSFKEKKGFGAENTKYKPQAWIPLDKAWQEATGLPGIPQGHITLLRGHSDTGKTTTLLECAAQCQKMGILPVLIITEVKFSFAFAKNLGLEFTDVVDPDTGEVVGHDGFFLYADRETLNTIEDVASYIADLMDEQEKGNLPYDLCFLWDSVGSVPCRMSVESKSNSNMWNAGALSQQFGNYIDQKIVLTRKQSKKYTSTLVCVNKIWNVVENAFTGQIGIRNKGGECLYYDASLVVNYGNPGSAGTAKLKCVADKKDYVWGKTTNVSIDKCHLGVVCNHGKIVMTPTGFISVSAVEKYKKEHREEWCKQLGSDKLEFVEEEETEDSGASFTMLD